MYRIDVSLIYPSFQPLTFANLSSIPAFYHLFRLKDTETSHTVSWDDIKENVPYQLILHPYQRNYAINNVKSDSNRHFQPKFISKIKHLVPEDLLQDITYYTEWDEEDKRWFYFNKKDSDWQLPVFENIRSMIIERVGEVTWNEYVERIGAFFVEEDEIDEVVFQPRGGDEERRRSLAILRSEVADVRSGEDINPSMEDAGLYDTGENVDSVSNRTKSSPLPIDPPALSPTEPQSNTSIAPLQSASASSPSASIHLQKRVHFHIEVPSSTTTPSSTASTPSGDGPTGSLVTTPSSQANSPFIVLTTPALSSQNNSPSSQKNSQPHHTFPASSPTKKPHPARRKSIFAFNLAKTRQSSTDDFSDFDTVNAHVVLPRSNSATEQMEFETQDLNDEDEIASMIPSAVVSSRSNSLEKYDRKNLTQDSGRGNLENTMEKELFPFSLGSGENRILCSVKANLIKDDAPQRREAHIFTIARDWSGQYVIVVSAIRSEKRLSTRRSRSQSVIKAPASSVTCVLPIIQSVEVIEDPNDEIVLEIDHMPLRMQIQQRVKEKLLSSLRFVLQALNKRNTSQTKAIHNHIACIDFTLEVFPVGCELATVERVYNQLLTAHKQEKPIEPLLHELRVLIRDDKNRDHLLIRLALLIKTDTTPSIYAFVLRVTEQVLICPRPIKKIGESWLSLIKYLQDIVESKGALAKRASAVVKRISELYHASLTYDSKAISMDPVPFPQDFLAGISVLSRRERQVAMHSKEIRSKNLGEGVFLALVYYNDASELIRSTSSFLPRFKLPNYDYEDAVQDGLTGKYPEVLNTLLGFGSSWASSIYRLRACKNLSKLEKSLAKLLSSLTDFKVNERMDLGMLYDRPSHFHQERTVILYSVHELQDARAMVQSVQYEGTTSPTRYELAPVSLVEHEFLEYYYPNFHPLTPLERLRTGFHHDRWIQNCINLCNFKKPLDEGTFLTFFRFRISEYGLQVQVDEHNRFCTPHVRIADYDVRKATKQWRWIQSLRLRQYLNMRVLTASDIRSLRDFPKRENLPSVSSFRARYFIALEKLKHMYGLDDLGDLLDERPIELVSGKTLLLAYASFCVDDDEEVVTQADENALPDSGALPGQQNPPSFAPKSRHHNQAAVWKDVDVLDMSQLEIYNPRVFEMKVVSHVERLKRGDEVRFTAAEEFKCIGPFSPTTITFEWLQNGGTSVVGPLDQYNRKEVDASALHAIVDQRSSTTAAAALLKQAQNIVLEECERVNCSWQSANDKATTIDHAQSVPVTLRSLQVESQQKHTVRSGGLSEWVQFPDENQDRVRPQMVSPFPLVTLAAARQSDQNSTDDECIDICWSLTHELIDDAFLQMFRATTLETVDVLNDLLDDVERLAHKNEAEELERKMQAMCDMVLTERYRVKQHYVDEFYAREALDPALVCPLSAEDLVQRMSRKFSQWVDHAHDLMQTIVSTQRIVELHDSAEDVNNIFVAREHILYNATTNAAAHMPEPVPIVTVSLADVVSESHNMLSEDLLEREANKIIREAGKNLFPSSTFSAQIQALDRDDNGKLDTSFDDALSITSQSTVTNTRAIHLLSQNGDKFVGFLHARKQHRARMLLECSETQNPIVTHAPSSVLSIICDYLCLASAEVKSFLRTLHKRLSQEQVDVIKFSEFCKEFQVPVLFVAVLWKESTTFDEFQIAFAASFLAEHSLHDYLRYEEELSHWKKAVDVMWYVRFRMDLTEIVSPALKYAHFEGKWSKHYARKRIETVLRYRIAVLPHSQVAEEVRLWKRHLGEKVKQISLKHCAHITDDELELVFATCKHLKKLNLIGTNVVQVRALAALYDLREVKIKE